MLCAVSIEKLQNGSWELPVRKLYLQTFKDKLYKMVPNYIMEPDCDSTKPNVKEVEEFSYEKGRILRTALFRDMAECMMRESWPKAAASYADLGGRREMVISDDNEKMEILKNKDEHEGEEMMDWVTVYFGYSRQCP